MKSRGGKVYFCRDSCQTPHPNLLKASTNSTRTPGSPAEAA